MPGYRRDPDNGWEIFQMKTPVGIMMKARGANRVESADMGMPREAQRTIVLLHQSEMGRKLSSPGVESFDNSGYVGTGIMAEQDPVPMIGDYPVVWKSGQEIDLFLTVARIQV